MKSKILTGKSNAVLLKIKDLTEDFDTNELDILKAQQFVNIEDIEELCTKHKCLVLLNADKDSQICFAAMLSAKYNTTFIIAVTISTKSIDTAILNDFEVIEC